MNNRRTIIPLAAILVLGVQACTYQPKVKVTEDEHKWLEGAMPEYGVEFRYPPEMVFSSNGKIIDGAGGDWVCDGLMRSPRCLGLDFERIPLGGYEGYRFTIRIIMITEAARINDLGARKYGWKDSPRSIGYPFNFQTDEKTLQVMIERLYAGYEPDWIEIAPISVDQKPGMHLARWMFPSSPRSEQPFEEIVAVPVSPTHVLLLHADYSPTLGETLFQNRRKLYRRIVDTVQFTQSTGRP